MKKILVVEDEERNMANAREAFAELPITGIFTNSYEEALPFIVESDAAILDIYIPQNKKSLGYAIFNEFIQSQDTGFVKFLEKSITNINVSREIADKLIADKFRLDNGQFPLGIILAKKFRDLGKPAIFVSNISSGHGSYENPFYTLRNSFDDIVPEAWCSSESPATIWSFVTEALEIKDGRGYKNTEKNLSGWLVSIKAIALLLEEKIELKFNERVEEKLATWLKEFYKK